MTCPAKRVEQISSQRNVFKYRTLSLAIAACLGTLSTQALANPTGATVASGTASFSTAGNTLTVTNSNGAIINWQQFNINAGETTRFIQPGAASSVLNRVVGGDPSQILGTLSSNGQVFLINPNGIVFGKSAVIDVPGLIASTLNLSDADFLARRFNFSGGGFGPLVNQGHISTPLGGSVMLIGSDVRNEGVITTPGGQVILAAGSSVSLTDTAGPEISVTLTAGANKAVNLGEITAAGGKIDMFGALIEQQGVLRADSASVDEQGRILLKATGSATVSGTISATNSAGQGGSIQVLGRDVTLAAGASLDASGATGGGQVLVGGDWQGQNPAVAHAQATTMAAGAVIKADATDKGNGGKVVLWSDSTTTFQGSISARGGAHGGNGGQVETSGHSLLLGGTVDTRAPKGAMGFWLLDPSALCFDDTSYSCSMGFSGATYISTASVAQALQTSSVAYTATDYITILGLSLNNASYNAGYVTQTGATLSFLAPYIAHYGTISAGNPLNVVMQASGVSTSYPGDSGLINSAGNISTHGGRITMDASSSLVLSTGTLNTIGTYGAYGATGTKNYWDIYLRAPHMSIGGTTVYANDLFLETNFVGNSCVMGTVDSLTLATYTPGTNINVGMGYTNPACSSALCVTSQFASLSINHDVTVAAGRCASGGSYCELDTAVIDGNIVYGGFVESPGIPSSRDLGFYAKNLTINQPVTVPSSVGELTLFAANSFINNVGPSAIDNSVGGTWSVVLGNEAGSNLNGLSAPKYSLTLATIAGYDHNNNWPAGNGIYVLAPELSNAITDPCFLTPSLCALNTPSTVALASDQTKVSVVTPTTSATTVSNSTPTAALAIDAKLTLPSTPAVSSTTNGTTTASSAATASTAFTQSTSSTQDSKVVVPKRDSEKSVAEVQAEAKSAKESAAKADADAKKLDAEAKKAEAEAKQAEAEAKSAKTAEAKEAAKQKAEAKKAEAEAKKAEAEAKKAEAEAKKAEAEDREALAEAKSATKTDGAAPAEARQTQAEIKMAHAEAKAAEAQARKAEAESKLAQAEGKQAEAHAREARAEARRAEAEMKAARTPEQKLAATQRAEVKKTEAEAHKTEAEAHKTLAEGKKMEADAKKAEAEVKKAEAEAKTATTPARRAAAEKRIEVKRAEADKKQVEAEAKQTEAEAKQARADAKSVEADAKGVRSPGIRGTLLKEAEAKLAEADHKQAEAIVKKAEAEVKQAESLVKKAEAVGNKAEALAKKAAMEAKKVEMEAKRIEAEKKRIEAVKKAEEYRIVTEKRKEERRIEAAKAFASVVTAGANRAALEDLAILRHELKTETLRPALEVLKKNPSAADLPPCGAGSSVCVPVASQITGNLPTPPIPKVAFLPQIQRKVAVVIGVNKYADPSIPSLDSAVPDAQAVGQHLKDQLGYDVKVVQDASRADIVTTLNKVGQEVGPNDSVTIYYAGHGYLSEKTHTGYWIPADAKATSPDNWISNGDIGKLLSNIPAKQVMLVSDSCYSGSLTKEQKIVGGAGTLDPSSILAKRSVTVMSSGGEEPVSDEGKEGHSIFAYSFMNALKSVKQVDSGAKLFEAIKSEVTRDFPQTPQYGGAVSAGHNAGGDYLLETRTY